MKRILSILLVAVMLLSLVACSNQTPNPTNPSNPSNPSQGEQNQTGDQGGNTTEPTPVLPDAPTEQASQRPYNPAYESLENITENVTIELVSFASTQVPTMNSVTMFNTNDELQGFVKQFADVGVIDKIECSLDENGFKYTYYWAQEIPADENNLYFFLASTEYSAQMITRVDKVVYADNQDTVYVMLKHSNFSFANLWWGEPDDYAKEYLDNSKASYQICALNLNDIADKVEHIVFVDPKPVPVCREDMNVSVIDFDAKYAELTLINPYSNPAVGGGTYAFPSTIKPEANKAELITSSQMMSDLLDVYSNIVNREKDYLIFEPLCVRLNHRTIGLNITTDSPILNTFVSAPGINTQCAIRTGDIRYDAATKTAYIHLEYNGMPITQYESYLDHEAINTESKATYVIVSTTFYKLDEYPIENVVIVLPDPATLPDFNK